MDKYIKQMLDNRYEILEVIGVGGMAVVYKARCHRLNRLVAVKILKDEYAKDADFRRRFHAESQAVAMLSHPNIVSVFDVSRSSDVEYIVMELIDGITLKQYMQKKGVLNWREALHFTTQIVRALSHAHNRGIIHRDIKPHNIMILRDGSVKVADFGIARFASKQNTLTQEALGSVHYISPEQARGSHIDARSDIYSVGVVMYEMLTARLPYEGDSPVSVAIQHINSIPLLPREINPDIPEALEIITMKAMTNGLSRRYSSAEAMLMDLDEFRKNPSISFDYDLSALYPTDTEVDEPTRSLTGGGAASNGTGGADSEVRKRIRKEILEEEDYNTKKSNSFIALLTGLLGVLVFVAIMGYIALNILTDIFSEKEMVDLPNLKNLSYDVELLNREYPWLNFDVILEQNEVHAENVIFKQEPAGPGKVVKDSVVTLYVSKGAEGKALPDFSNQDVRDVQIKLYDLGLLYSIDEITYEASDDIISGRVIYTVPAAGDIVYHNQYIKLIVSAGPSTKKNTVPKVVGMSRQEAVITLEGAGFTVRVREEESDLPAGEVIKQSVEADTEVLEKTLITIDVSIGPAEEDPAVTDDPGETPNNEDPGQLQSLDPSVTTSATPSEPPDGVDTTPEDTPSATPTEEKRTLRRSIELKSVIGHTVVTIYLNDVLYYNQTVNNAALNGKLSVDITGYPKDIVKVLFDGVEMYTGELGSE